MVRHRKFRSQAEVALTLTKLSRLWLYRQFFFKIVSYFYHLQETENLKPKIHLQFLTVYGGLPSPFRFK